MFKLARSKHFHWTRINSLVLGVTSRTSSNVKITIPKRKTRGPTDILQALSSTVGRDPTAAHHKYHDDPFLIPLSNTNKRAYALAQEAGRKAAKWIVNENAQLFHHKEAEPPIQVFAPKVLYDENSQIEEATLLKVIEDGNVSDAVIIYNLLQNRGSQISEETQQAMLELVCFTNEEDILGEDYIEERWFSTSQRQVKSGDQTIKQWRDRGLADTIFKSMAPAKPQAYSALIQGMARFGQIEKAWQAFEEAREKSIQLHVGAFNAIISVVNALRQSPELRWQLLQELLARMVSESVRPDLGTLNACLQTVSGMGGPDAVTQAFSVLAEFRLVGIEPSLASFYYILFTGARDRSRTADQAKILSDILARLDNCTFEIRDPVDTKFFVKAMEVCRYSAQDSQLGRQIDQLLHQGDNYNLIGDSYNESIYYRHFFHLLCATEPMDAIMKTYDDLVPHVYTPEPSVMQELIKVADLSGAIELLPRFWTDIVAHDQTDREQLLSQLLDTLVRNEPQHSSPLVNTYAEIATSIWDKIENQPANRTNVVSWSGEMLSNVLTLWSRNKSLDSAVKVMKKLRNEQAYIGEASIDALCVYVDLCVVQKDFDKALDCINFCKETGRAEAASMAKDLRNRLTLSDEQAQRLSELFL